MAITKVITIRNRLDQRVGYVLNPNKTSNETHYYETAINCSKDNAYGQMMTTKKRWDKVNRVQGYHIIQSFAPDEVTPEVAHKIGVEFAEKCFDKYEVVIGTHLDKDHLHNHIIFNSVSFVDGKKHRNNFKDYYCSIRNTSDELCKKYSLSVVEKTDMPKSTNYIEWRARQTGDVTYQSQIREDIDECINMAFNFGNFIYLMETKGYDIKKGKYISIKPFEGKHFSRGYKLGYKYSYENLRRRVDGKDLAAEFITLQAQMNTKREYVPYKKVKKGSFRALLIHYMYLLGQIKTKEAPDEVVTICKKDLKRFDELISNINYITDRQFKTVEQVERHIDDCYVKINKMKHHLKTIKQKYSDKEPLFKALKQYKFYEKAHQLFEKGYYEFDEENKLYLSARKDLGINTEYNYKITSNLEADYSNYQNDLSITNEGIQDMKAEIKKSKTALQMHEQAEKRIEQIESYRTSIEQNRELSARDMARKLNER